MTRLELLPGLLPVGEAQWARQSRLVAAGGVLEVHRGRRIERHELRGCLLHPSAPVRDLGVSCVVVLADSAGEAYCAIDLADWVPGGSQRADRRVGRQLGEPFGEVRDALGRALEARVSSTQWTGELPRIVPAADMRAAWVRRFVLLALAVVAVVAPVFGMIAVGLAGGAAAVGLVVLGMSPVRRWHPRSLPMAWTKRAGHLRDEVSLSRDGSALWVMTTAPRRAGALPIGSQPWQVDRLDVDRDGDTLLLSMGAVPVVELGRETWGDVAFDLIAARLRQVDGIRSRDRTRDRHALIAAAAALGSTRPAGSVGGNVALAALAVVAAASVPVPVAALYGVAAVIALALAAELLISRREPASKDNP